ncbi:tail fiber domain-containing protein [Flavobacterium branchiarum]|uniref:Tail fiber domain-containing protein n=1 Tax=Flavobacterium branchiarum TaxID=1114870 RepID=A0ABV5FQW6_9FLAO|nr:tail fiber domain-containing protein [Flavobacterium branchiarum]MDN3671706.1 tail fiber domain-containing protein [Flavobacterium branchiarum]
MKKLFIFLFLTACLAVSAQGTIPAYSTVKLTKTMLGTPLDSALVKGANGIVKHLPVSEIKGTTNLDQLATPTGITVFSSTGNDAVLPLATTTNAGLQSPADKTKLDGLSNFDPTTINNTLATKVDKVSGKGLSTEDYTTAEKTKLAGIATGATANDTDANLKNRANHTGTQAISTVIGLQAAIDAKLNLSLVGANNGVAPLDAGGKVPFANLPASLMIYKSMWDAAGNTPTLSDATGVVGWVYKVSVGGTINLGSGNITFLAADFLIHNGTKWERSPGTDAVVSVNGQQGIVTLTTSNIADSANKRYQTDLQQSVNDASSSIQTQLNGKQAVLGFTPYNATNPAGYISSYTETDPTVPVYSKSLTSFDVIAANADSRYKLTFTEKTAFNKDFGSTSGTVAQGNDGRISNGQTAFGWGSHAGLYPLYNGTGATGTWGINISGLAANSTKWNGENFGVHTSEVPINLLGYNVSTARWEPKTSAESRSFLGINDGSTLNNNISGNAGSATYWGNRTADLDALDNGIDYFVTRTSGFIKLSSVGGVQVRLGLGSNAYSSIAYLPLTGGDITNNLGVNAGYGFGFTLLDGFSITRQSGFTQFNYGGNSKMELSSTGINVKGNIGSDGYFSLNTNIDNDSSGNPWYGLGKKTDSYVNLNGWAGIRLKTYGGSVSINQDGSTSFPGTTTATSFVTAGGTSSQFVKGDGSLTSAVNGTTAAFTDKISNTGGGVNFKGANVSSNTIENLFAQAAVNIGDNSRLLFGTSNADGRLILQSTDITGAARTLNINAFGGEVSIGTAGVNSLMVHGNLRYSGSLSQVSDVRVKKNIRPLNNSLDKITKINCYTYDRTDDNSKDQMGVIAQELEKIYPELITTGKYGEIEDFKTVNYSGLIPALIEAVKEQQKTIDKLNLRLEILEGK